MSSSADRELLFGILALQNRVITREQLLAGFDAWSRDKSLSLGEHLVALGGLKLAHLHVVQPLVNTFIEQHGGDAAQSLAGISSAQEAQAALASFSDADLQASLRRVATRLEANNSEYDYPTVDAPRGSDFDTNVDVEVVGGRFRILDRMLRVASGESASRSTKSFTAKSR